jgi:hypothetical protein
MISTQRCAHLAASIRQPQAVLPGDNDRPTFYCAPCIADRCEALLRQGTNPIWLAEHIDLTKCRHHPKGLRCSVCYNGVIGSLMLYWSWLRLQEKVTDALLIFHLGQIIKHMRYTHAIANGHPKK